MAAECIKNCCMIFLNKNEPEEVIEMRIPPAKVADAGPGGVSGDDLPKGVGVSEDYLMSKLPPDGKEIPFVLPKFMPSYVQPRCGRAATYHLGQRSATLRSTYAERKSDIVGSTPLVYNPDFTFHPGQLGNMSPGPVRRVKAMSRTKSPKGSGLSLTRRRLSSSMGDLPNPKSHSREVMERYSSVSNVLSCASSTRDSFGSTLSLESVNLSGDERDLGKICVRLCYQDALEQLWITLVQCTDLCVTLEGVETTKIGVKGIITMAKPVQFKSSLKELSQDVVFMETFVFALHLQQLRCSALVLRLQLHHPRKRTLAECVLSLRQLGPVETEHWLDLSPPSKTSACHSELQLTTCFQPVSGRIQLQILTAQNLPASFAPLHSLAFFVKVELHHLDKVVMKKKTAVLKSSECQCHWRETFHFPLAAMDEGFQLAIKLYSRSSIRRTHFLGQVHLGFESYSQEAAEQWRDTMGHPEKVVSTWHRLSKS